MFGSISFYESNRTAGYINETNCSLDYRLKEATFVPFTDVH